MKTLSKTHHLINRDGVWYYRRRVPKDLISKIGKKFIQVSLKTKDLNEAVKKRELKDIETTALFETAKKGEAIPLTRNDVIRMIQNYVETQDQKWREQSLKHPPQKEEERYEIRVDLGLSEQPLRDLDDLEGQFAITRTRKRIFEARGYQPDEK